MSFPREGENSIRLGLRELDGSDEDALCVPGPEGEYPSCLPEEEGLEELCGNGIVKGSVSSGSPGVGGWMCTSG